MSWGSILDQARGVWKEKTDRGSIGDSATIDLAHCNVTCSSKLAEEIWTVLSQITDRTPENIETALKAIPPSPEHVELKLRIDRLLTDKEFLFSKKIAKARSLQEVYGLIYAFYNRAAVVKARGLHEAIQCLVVAVYRFVDFEADNADVKKAMRLPTSLRTGLCGTQKIEGIYADALLAALRSGVVVRPSRGDSVSELFVNHKRLEELEVFAKAHNVQFQRNAVETLSLLLGYLHRTASRLMSLTVDQALATMKTWKTWTGYKSAFADAATGLGAGVANVATGVGQWWQHFTASDEEESE